MRAAAPTKRLFCVDDFVGDAALGAPEQFFGLAERHRIHGAFADTYYLVSI